MAEERYGSSVRTLGGRTDNGSSASDANEGVVGQVSDTVRSAYDKTKDTAMEGAETVKDAALAGHDFLKRFMEENPHTTTIIALGIGLLIGYAAHRPPPPRSWWNDMTSR
jgi:ElaB/YqjD/DUF883 family membrane-anchored ribosome-binding protein